MKSTNSTPAQAKPAKQPDTSRGSEAPRPADDRSASERATERARRGEPLEADRQRERSPKQENL